MPSSRHQFAQHVRVSSTEDLSYNVPTGTGGTKDVIQTIVTGRKCWKTMKGKGEVVWPPHLEAALVEGERLLNYSHIPMGGLNSHSSLSLSFHFVSHLPSVTGLEQYRPVETRSTRALGRFPMRNKFISGTFLRYTWISARPVGSLRSSSALLSRRSVSQSISSRLPVSVGRPSKLEADSNN